MIKKLIIVIILFGVFGIGSVFGQEFTLKSGDLSGQLTEMQVFKVNS